MYILLWNDTHADAEVYGFTSFEDAKHFKEKGDFVTAFAALNYAHGFLDAGARLGVFDVKDNKLFAVDDET